MVSCRVSAQVLLSIIITVGADLIPGESVMAGVMATLGGNNAPKRLDGRGWRSLDRDFVCFPAVTVFLIRPQPHRGYCAWGDVITSSSEGPVQYTVPRPCEDGDLDGGDVPGQDLSLSGTFKKKGRALSSPTVRCQC